MPVARISAQAQKTLKSLSTKTGKTIQEILDEAVESYRRFLFLEVCNDAFARLKEDPKAWQEEKKERDDFDETLLDGLKNE